MTTEKFEMHCVVELFGHTTIAGKVSEQTIGGASFIRVDVPKTSKRDGFTRFYGPGAIYAMTPVSEEIAVLMAERLEVEVVSEWKLQEALRSRLLAAATTRELEGQDAAWEDDDEPVYTVALPKKEGAALSGNAVEDVLCGDLADDVEGWHDEDNGDQPQAGQRAVAQWARELLKGEFVIIDTETTGFEADGEIIQIGIIDQAGATVLERLIKPTKSILNANYHGITDDMLANAPGFPEVYGQIKLALQGKVVLAYNTEYDSRMLSQVCRKHGLEEIVPSATHCVMEQYAQFNGEWNDYHGNYRWKKLREALAAFGLKHEDFGTKEHDACTDARATLAVIKKMAEFDAAPTAAV